MNKYSDISENAKDVLMEIGNIGTGNAVTALSSILMIPEMRNISADVLPMQ